MKIKLILALVVAMNCAVSGFAQELKKEFIDPQPNETRSAAVKVKGGTMMFLAGHTASQSNPNAELGNFEAQFKAVFDKIGITLKQAGGNVDDIVSMSVFLTDLRFVPQFSKLAKELFKKSYPAVTFIEVSHLARPTSFMEVQPIAVLP